MGDSAGGGLALGLAQELYTAGYTMPDHLILISPWIDVTGNNPEISRYESVDPMLSSPVLLAAAKCWAGDTELTSPKLSPIYGELSSLPPITIFVGTRELFYPDIILLYEKLKCEENQTTLIVGKGMNHVYPLYPIPEAKVAVKKIVNQIQSE